ncbi:methyl-accepting chemotaxis protein [Jiella sp. MQZ9-1]|uniref:PAS domain-containing protein n=1 Tax=Jiella flava TaxID=2816857 RepID=A0A939FWP4_9HYPH|nr:methyl-accepting chemotaxis protein [Jiella flava]MBO0663368.1 PAS domain-containing protein [Jiella flava]MCD2471944.1 methyl-accepting chemotaxis protein [Jiella flava]
MSYLRFGIGSDATNILAALEEAMIVVEFDLGGQVLQGNQWAHACFERGANEFGGLTHTALLGENAQDAAADQSFWRRLLEGEAQSCEWHYQTKAGSGAWFKALYQPVRGRSKKPYKIIALAWDISKDKQIVAEMAGKLAAISRFQAVLEFSPDGMVLAANANALGLLGYDSAEVVGRHHRELVEPDYANSQEYRDFWDKLGRGEFVAGEFQRLGKGGRLIHMQASYNPVLDARGKPLKIVKFATDVTDRVEAVAAIGLGLERLAHGDLSQRLEHDFLPALDPIRVDFNRSLDTLEAALARVEETASSIAGATEEIRIASSDLAKRTETQATSVEETAAAITELSANIRVSATAAEEAGILVAATTADAKRSGQIVGDAIASMSGIEESSNKITSIITVIDEIAFQTNLLALNAGVEAARAGEAGKGFAVVAQEVRELAQRSAKAAREIKTLINASSQQVADGVARVGETGEALEAILTEFETIDEKVQAIVAAARAQATGLDELNHAIGSIDRDTQQNAAMVEESSAACHGLATDTQQLDDLLAAFQLSSPHEASNAARAKRRNAAAQRASAAQGSACIALASSQATGRPDKLPNATAFIRNAPATFGRHGAELSRQSALPDQWEEF